MLTYPWYASDVAAVHVFRVMTVVNLRLPGSGALSARMLATRAVRVPCASSAAERQYASVLIKHCAVPNSQHGAR